MGVHQDTELVDGDHDARGRGRHPGGVGAVALRPLAQVGDADAGQLALAVGQQRPYAPQGPGSRPRVDVGEDALGVGQARQGGEGRAALVVDEDQAHPLGRVVGAHGEQPREQGLRLARPGAPRHQGVRAVGHQVQDHLPVRPNAHGRGEAVVSESVRVAT